MPQAARLLKSLATWLALYALAILPYNAMTGPREALVHRFQIEPSAWLLGHTMPGIALRHTPTSILAPGLEVQIRRGCDGAEAWLLVATAMLAFPMPWRRRWLGAALGTVLVFSLNLVRTVSLFHIAVQKPGWMEAAHVVVWQSLVFAMVAAFVLVWLDPRRLPPPGSRGKP